MIKWPQSFTEFMFWILFVLKDCFLWLHEVLQYIFNHNSNEFWKGPFQVCLGHVVDFSYCNDMNNLHHKEAIVKVKKKVKEKPPEVMIFEPKRQEQGEKNPPKISKKENSWSNTLIEHRRGFIRWCRRRYHQGTQRAARYAANLTQRKSRGLVLASSSLPIKRRKRLSAYFCN